MCHPARKGDSTHAGSGPLRVRRRLFCACLGDSITLATRSHLSLHRHPETSRDVVEETLLILQEIKYMTFSLNWSIPYQDGCSQVLISSRGSDSSICDWKSKFSLFGKYHLFRIESFLSRFPMRPSFPTPRGLRSVRHPSKFTPRRERINPGKTFFPN